MAKTDKKEPKVIVMGENINPNQSHFNSTNTIWGLFLIFIGIIFLLNTFEVVSWQIWADVFKFWPFLLILAGVNIILGDNKISNVVVSIIAIFVFVLIFITVMEKAIPGSTDNLPMETKTLTQPLQYLLE